MVDATPNYAGNSHKSRSAEIAASGGEEAPKERTKLEPVISTPVSHRKKPLGKRLAETFTGDDARNVLDYVLKDVVVPAVKNTLVDVVSQGIERMIYGDVRPGRNRGVRGVVQQGMTNYQSASAAAAQNRGYDRPAEPARRPALTTMARSTHNFDEILFSTRGEAELVIDSLRGRVAEYGSASVADFYELISETGDYTDNKYGWEDLSAASTLQVRGGYLLNLPQPIQLV